MGSHTLQDLSHAADLGSDLYLEAFSNDRQEIELYAEEGGVTHTYVPCGASEANNLQTGSSTCPNDEMRASYISSENRPACPSGLYLGL